MRALESEEKELEHWQKKKACSIQSPSARHTTTSGRDCKACCWWRCMGGIAAGFTAVPCLYKSRANAIFKFVAAPLLESGRREGTCRSGQGYVSREEADENETKQSNKKERRTFKIRKVPSWTSLCLFHRRFCSPSSVAVLILAVVPSICCW